MQQWNRELLEFHALQWLKAMNTTDNFSAEIRSKDAVDKHSDKNLSSLIEGMGKSTARVEKALACISNRGYLQKDMDALDIGSGNGVFTLPFAKYYRSVTSLDISAPMQNEIRNKAAQSGLTNINYVTADWRNLDLKEMNMRERYDLVLCSINPRGVCNYDTLNKMNQASRQGCCLIAFTGRSASNHGADIQQIILGRCLQTTGGNNIIFPFNVVYHMGGEPDMAYAPMNWERRQKPADAIDDICFNYWRFAEITDEIRNRVAEYVYANLEDGEYVDRTENLIGIMVWDAWRVRKNGLA